MQEGIHENILHLHLESAESNAFRADNKFPFSSEFHGQPVVVIAEELLDDEKHEITEGGKKGQNQAVNYYLQPLR